MSNGTQTAAVAAQTTENKKDKKSEQATIIQVVPLEEASTLVARFENMVAKAVDAKLSEAMTKYDHTVKLQEHVGEKHIKNIRSALDKKDAIDVRFSLHQACQELTDELIKDKKVSGDDDKVYVLRRRSVLLVGGAVVVGTAAGGYLLYKHAEEKGIQKCLAMRIQNVYRASDQG